MRYVRLRGKWFYYRRRVPLACRDFYEQDTIKIALKTDPPTIAYQRAEQLNAELERIWGTLDQESPEVAQALLNRTIRQAQFGCLKTPSTRDLAEGDLAELVRRVLAVEQTNLSEDPHGVAALLGSEKHESLLISAALEEFFAFETPNKAMTKGGETSDQMRKWKNPRKPAIKNFIEVCGDVAVDQVHREHIIAFRQWWYDRIRAEGLKANSANKNFSHLRVILSFMRDDKGLDIDVEKLFARVNLTEHDSDTRSRPFEANYIQNALLDLNNLEGLNLECQMLLFAAADTGARPNELIGLNPENAEILLDEEIPHIHIRPNGIRQLKTPHSKRSLLLVGAALYAFRNLPNGFERYRGRPDALSATLNKYLRTHDLLPSKQHCVYSLWHSFEDRLTAVEPPEKIQAMLMGHKYERERYGDGPTLEQKKSWLEKICFNVAGD